MLLSRLYTRHVIALKTEHRQQTTSQQYYLGHLDRPDADSSMDHGGFKPRRGEASGQLSLSISTDEETNVIRLAATLRRSQGTPRI